MKPQWSESILWSWTWAQWKAKIQGCQLFNLVCSDAVKLLWIWHGHSQGHPEQDYSEHFSKLLKENIYLFNSWELRSEDILNVLWYNYYSKWYTAYWFQQTYYVSCWKFCLKIWKILTAMQIFLHLFFTCPSISIATVWKDGPDFRKWWPEVGSNVLHLLRYMYLSNSFW